jgi:hypothetical protein
MDEETQAATSDSNQADLNAGQEVSEEETKALQADLEVEQAKLSDEQAMVAQEAAAVRALDVQINNDPTVHRSFAR